MMFQAESELNQIDADNNNDEVQVQSAALNVYTMLNDRGVFDYPYANYVFFLTFNPLHTLLVHL